MFHGIIPLHRIRRIQHTELHIEVLSNQFLCH